MAGATSSGLAHVVRPLLLAACASAVAWSAPAAAQSIDGGLLGSEFRPTADRGRNVSVRDRERPEFEATGIRAGSFDIFPRAEIGVGYSDNVYALETNRIDDAFLVFDPSILVDSDWGAHDVALYAAGRFREFASETAKNEEGFTLRGEGRLDIDRVTSANGGLSIDKLYEQRTSGSFPIDALASVPFYRTVGYGRLTRQNGRVRTILGGDVTWLKFDNVIGLNGRVLDQKDRDRQVDRVVARIDYAFSFDAAVFGQVSYADTDYDRPLAIGLANRDGNETRIIGGLSFDLTALIRGEAGIGYVDRNYNSPLFPDIGGVVAEVRLEYFLSGLTTVSGAVRRYIEDSNVIGSGGYYATVGNIGVDHELLRNLILSAKVAYERDDYRGIVRHDDIWAVNGGARYLVSRSIGLGFDFGYLSRRTDAPLFGAQFDEVRASTSVIFQR